MLSIILPNVTLGGDPFKTLLPFQPSEVGALDRLFTLTRGVELFSDVLFHIGRYGTYHAKPDAKNLAREKYYTLFEALFEPYYNSPPRDNPEHRKDLNEILDKAVKYGMTVLRRTTSVIEERWGDRPDKIITDRPGLYCCFSRGRRWCGVKSWFKVAARTRGLPLLRLEDRVWSLDDKFPMGRIRGSFDFER